MIPNDAVSRILDGSTIQFLLPADKDAAQVIQSIASAPRDDTGTSLGAI